MISIWMFRIGGSSIWELLELIFKSSIENGTFPSDWKKADVALAHKKLPRTTINNYHKQLPRNYCPISILLICGGKVLENLIYNKSLNFSQKITQFFLVNQDLNLATHPPTIWYQ